MGPRAFGVGCDCMEPQLQAVSLCAPQLRPTSQRPDSPATQAVAAGKQSIRMSRTRDPAARNLSGCLAHTWTCRSCGHVARAKEVFSCLSLQLPPSGCVRLEVRFGRAESPGGGGGGSHPWDGVYQI